MLQLLFAVSIMINTITSFAETSGVFYSEREIRCEVKRAGTPVLTVSYLWLNRSDNKPSEVNEQILEMARKENGAVVAVYDHRDQQYYMSPSKGFETKLLVEHYATGFSFIGKNSEICHIKGFQLTGSNTVRGSLGSQLRAEGTYYCGNESLVATCLMHRETHFPWHKRPIFLSN